METAGSQLRLVPRPASDFELPPWTSFVPAQMRISTSGSAILIRHDSTRPPEPGILYPIHLRAHAEGAANVLFTIECMQTLDPGSKHPHISPAHEEYLGGSLLRLRKGKHMVPLSGMTVAPKSLLGHDIVAESAAPPPYVSAGEIHDFVMSFVASKFSDANIVKHTVVDIEPELLVLCNQHLVEWEEKDIRALNRRGWYLQDDESSALLVTDMGSTNRPHSFTVELKPKWLCQSPCAPPAARRCRTCAFQELKGTPYRKRFCPLALCSGNRALVKAQLCRILKEVELPEWVRMEQALGILEDYFCSPHPTEGLHLLRRLADVQCTQDLHGVLRELDVSKSHSMDHTVAEALKAPRYGGFRMLSTAMTMRDCTLFLRVTIQHPGPEEQLLGGTSVGSCVEARLADLDPKIPDPAKLLKWRMDEHNLLTGGFYDGTNPPKVGTQPKDEICILYKQHFEHHQ